MIFDGQCNWLKFTIFSRKIRAKRRRIQIKIPGLGSLTIAHIVMDNNGTLACDGKLLAGGAELPKSLNEAVYFHVVTADTFGVAQKQLRGLPCTLTILPPEDQDIGKLEYIRKFREQQTLRIGNGRNDALMIEHAALGIAVIQAEGAYAQTVLNSDVVCRTIYEALELSRNPDRLQATLRTFNEHHSCPNCNIGASDRRKRL
ncbi:MAG: hypothetical protein KA072_12200 [Thermoanaerobaculaceae bacterium]|nr:hypothetical protein [Thermoanaerobaculaceae bacterium]MDI9622248.1 ATPase P [Acidobacteriota bacterium]HPW56299.1 hypothetical protein [Thermoanaerobaculaceae bacterium]